MSTVRRPSLGRVLVFSFGAVAVAAVVLTAVITISLARIGAPARAIAALRTEAANGAELASGLPCTDGTRPGGGAIARQLGARARFVPDGTVRKRFAQFGSTEGRTTIGGRSVLYASARTTLCGRPGTLYVTRLANEVPALPEGFASRLVVAAILALLLSVGVAYAMSRRLSRPLRELTGSARALARGEHAAASANAGDPAEVVELKNAFDQMVSDLASAREREKTFLLSVSHELRTPLTAIRGYGEALSDGTTNKPREAGDVILRESQRLERLVQDLLDLGRLESGEFSVRAMDVDLAQIAADVARSLQPSGAEHDVRIDVAAPVSSVVRTDPDRVHQMLANLVENALRVSPAGSAVTIEVGPHAVAVSDEGPGLDPSDLAHAFDRFYLWRRYHGVRPVGSGLGLAIVGELSRRLGAHVDVRSPGDNGHGSRFEIRFGA